MGTANNVKRCKTCGCTIAKGSNPIDAGYAINEAGDTVCYKCCGESERQYMIENGKIDLYLVSAEVINWPGTLRFKVKRSKSGGHNIAKVRTDVWFDFEGYEWHGTAYGVNSEVCYCRKTKRRVV